MERNSSPLPFRGGAGGGAVPQTALLDDKPHPNPSPEACPERSRRGEGLKIAPHVLALCAIAARSLGWRPHEFWAATPAELAAALGLPAPPTGPGIDRDTLQRLMEHDNG